MGFSKALPKMFSYAFNISAPAGLLQLIFLEAGCGVQRVVRTLLRKLSYALEIAKLPSVSLMHRNQEASRIKAKLSLKAQRNIKQATLSSGQTHPLTRSSLQRHAFHSKALSKHILHFHFCGTF